MAKHLAIFNDHLAEAVIEGKKSVDFRFAQKQIAPYLKVKKTDQVLIKNVSEPVIGLVEVDNVLYFDGLNLKNLNEIKRNYLNLAGIDEKEFDALSSGASYLSVIFLKRPKRFIAPFKIEKRDRRGWLVIED
jgi:predicted transcriptional regulator